MFLTSQPGSLGMSDGVRQAWRRLLWMMLLRVGLISVLLGATLILNYGTVSAFRAPSPAFLLGLIAFTYVATIGYAFWYRAGKGIVRLAWTQIGIDCLLWACLAYATGGIASGFTFLFDLWVIVAAVVLGGRAAFINAGLSSLVLITLSFLMWQGVLPPLSDQMSVTPSLRSTLYFLGLNVMGLFVVAGLVSSLVGRLEKTGKGLEEERVQRADLAALHTDIIQSLTVGLATTGPSGEVLNINPAGRQILNLGTGYIGDSKFTKWFPDLRSAIEEHGNVDIRGHSAGLTANGKRVPVEYTVAPLLNADGRRRGSIVVFNDLTMVKKLEADLERARKLAAMGELAASLAHEIRNPLSAVSGSFQMLVSSQDMDEEDQSLTEIVSRELKRMERLVNDMLEFARPREPRRQKEDLGLLVEEVVKAFLYGQEAEGRQVDAYVEEGVFVMVDQSQIRQVLWNLLRNAAQATDEGGVIEVGTGRTEDGWAVFEVADDGVGISRENLSRVFDPFFSTRERGLGLGLSICQRIVEGHGGLIEAPFQPDGGTVFRVKLPETPGGN